MAGNWYCMLAVSWVASVLHVASNPNRPKRFLYGSLWVTLPDSESRCYKVFGGLPRLWEPLSLLCLSSGGKANHIHRGQRQDDIPVNGRMVMPHYKRNLWSLNDLLQVAACAKHCASVFNSISFTPHNCLAPLAPYLHFIDLAGHSLLAQDHLMNTRTSV